MTFIYNTGVPAANNNPSNDQPDMLVNTQSINSILAVDHVTFGLANGGTHNQMTMTNPQADPGFAPAPAVQTRIYPKAFTGSGATYLETFTAARDASMNQINGYLPFVKAMGQFTVPAADGAAAVITADTLSINVASVTKAGNFYTVVFSQALVYATYYPFVFRVAAAPNVIMSISSRSQNSFVIRSASGAGEIIGFMVI